MTADDVFAGGGALGARMREVDWAATPLGPVESWPQSLRTSLSICLSSRFPIVLFWGPELALLYNEAYVPFLGNKHPGSIGQPGLVVWSEISQVIEPMLRGVMRTGQATWSEDLMLPIRRGEIPEESYFTFTYSPIRVESGGVGGVFCAVVETTDRVLEERRLRLLNALAETTSKTSSARDVCAQAAARIAQARHDVPFALLYLADETSSTLELAGAANIEPGTALSPRLIRPGDRTPWPLEPGGGRTTARLETPVAGASEVVVLPIERAGIIVAGLSPLLSKSPSYERFHTLLAASISQAVGNAVAYEQERRRAEALAEIDRAKTAFFSNVSHELRTPLTLILGPMEDALSSAGGGLAGDNLRTAHRNVLRLSKLVNTLLDFSRIEAGRAQAAYEKTDLSAFTAELASVFRSAIEHAGLRFVVDMAPTPESYVDRDMWEKIVLNLLSNALKFTLAGEIAISLRPEGEDVALVVRDTGTGVPAAEIPHLFERFHRVRGARARTHEGSGIGLALVSDLVKLHGGHIRVESEEGRWTMFEVRVPAGARHLPRDRVVADSSRTPAVRAAAPYVAEALRWLPDTEPESTAPASERARERILLADDNADMREYLARLLRERWDVEAVGDGLAALEAMRRRPPHLVLSDVMMPGLDGFGLLRAVRGDDALKEIPVILLSARAGEEATEEGLRAGADDYLVKPFTSRELFARITGKIASSSSTRALKDSAAAVRQSEERFRALAEERGQLVERLEEAVRFAEQFVGILGHDLRNPLSAIQMNADLLKRDAGSQGRATDRILSSTARMTNMVGQLLDLTRSRLAGGIVVERKATSLTDVVANVIDELRVIHPSRDIRSALAGDVRGDWDPGRLAQVVSNLVDNALQYGDRSRPIDVRLAAPGAEAVLEVQSFGPPIAPELIPVLFDPYRRGETRGSRRKGLGLGLFISRQIVAAHGGAIDVASDTENGTIFTVSLPRTGGIAAG